MFYDELDIIAKQLDSFNPEKKFGIFVNPPGDGAPPASNTPPTTQALPKDGTPPSPGSGGTGDAAPPPPGDAGDTNAETEEQKTKRFQDQCFLIDAWKVLQEKNAGKKYNSLIPVNLHASEIISVMAREPGAGVFLKLTPAQLSLLVPQIRIYIVDYKVSGHSHSESGLRELFFEDHLNPDDLSKIFQGSAGRGSGAGIENFTYTWDGGNPFTKDKVLACTLGLVFTDMGVLTRPQPNGAAYIDLVERIPKRKSAPPEIKPNPPCFSASKGAKKGKKTLAPSRKVLNPDYQKIKVKVGWALPKGSADDFLSNSFFDMGNQGSVTKLLERFQLELFMEYVGSEFKFQPDGKINMNIKYRSGIESAMVAPEANLFFELSEKIREAANTRAEGIQDTAEEANQEKTIVKDGEYVDVKPDPDKAKEKVEDATERYSEEYEAQVKGLKHRLWQEFLELIRNQHGVKYVDVPKEKLKEWSTGIADAQASGEMYAAARSGSSTRTTADTILGDAAFGTTTFAAGETGESEGAAEGTKRIHYLYLGDIIDAAMGKYSKNSEKVRDAKTRMIVATMSIPDPLSGVTKDVNICDIPVSLEEFNVWYKDTVIDKNKTAYMILAFLNDIMSKMIWTALGSHCYGGSIAPGQLGASSFQYTLTDRNKEPIPKKEGGYPRVTSKPALRKIVDKHSGKGKDAQGYMNYMVLHASTHAAATMNPGDLEADEKNGVYHFGLGMDRGIIKSIDFKASKIKGNTEYRTMEGGAKNIAQLYQKYDADISIWGCPMFRNGQYLYIDPRTMGVTSGLATTLGLGGYYMITKVSGELGRNGYQVKLTTRYQHNGQCNASKVETDNAGAFKMAPGSEDPTQTTSPDHNYGIEPGTPGVVDLLGGGPPPPPPTPPTQTNVDDVPPRDVQP